MKTIRCNLTKAFRFLQFSQNHYIRIWRYFLKKFKTFHPFIEELYARLISFVYVRSIEFVSILAWPSFKGL